MIARTARGVIAAALVVAGVAFIGAPATAAPGGQYCAGSGVNVVIDNGALGGGVVKGCGQGAVAADAINSAGFALTYLRVGGMTGFVCTVSGRPADRQCSGANGQGYWALFIADPGGPWIYASLGANSQPVSSGQTVSFSWQAPNSGQRPPTASPAAKVSAPKPSPGHSPSTPQGATTSSSTSVSPGPTSSATMSSTTSSSAIPRPTATRSAHSAASTIAMPSPQANTSAQMPVATPPSGSGGGLPWWVPTGVVIVLVGGAATAWWRKRAAG